VERHCLGEVGNVTTAWWCGNENAPGHECE